MTSEIVTHSPWGSDVLTTFALLSLSVTTSPSTSNTFSARYSSTTWYSNSAVVEALARY